MIPLTVSTLAKRRIIGRTRGTGGSIQLVLSGANCRVCCGSPSAGNASGI
jgi:hypothetical protein